MQKTDQSSSLHGIVGGPLRIPHPLECAPRRPYRPKWLPNIDRDYRGCETPTLPRTEGWHSPVIQTGEGGGAVRINFTYRNGATNTSARFGMKPRCLQYTEGPHEKLFFRYLETNSAVIDYQFQIARIEWRTSAGLTRSYTCDGGWQNEDGQIIFFEVKAHDAYFRVPDFQARLDEAQIELAQFDIGFAKISGEDLADPVRMAMVNEVYQDRLTPVSEANEQIALETLQSHEGSVPLGLIREQLHGDPRLASSIANAMLVRRIIGFKLDKPVTNNTPVHRPKMLRRGCRTLRNLSF